MESGKVAGHGFYTVSGEIIGSFFSDVQKHVAFKDNKLHIEMVTSKGMKARINKKTDQQNQWPWGKQISPKMCRNIENNTKWKTVNSIDNGILTVGRKN